MFGDPTLRGLIQEALAGNYDLRIAAERVQQARAQSMIARAAFFPTIGYTANAQRSKQFEAQQHLSPPRMRRPGIRLNRLLAYVKLYKALGGGWDVKDPETPPPASASLGELRAACAGTRC